MEVCALTPRPRSQLSSARAVTSFMLVFKAMSAAAEPRCIGRGRASKSRGRTKLFVHGVPDTGYVWTLLTETLGLADDGYAAPTMPGFNGTRSAGFEATKEAYLDWLSRTLQATAERHGPVDLVEHGWGAPLCAMPALARPDTIRTWTALQRRGKTDDRKLDWTYVSRTLNAVVAKVRCPPSFRCPLGGRSADGLTAATGWNVR